MFETFNNEIKKNEAISTRTIWIDGFEFGSEDSIPVEILEHDRLKIEKQIAQKLKIDFCEKCGILHKSVSAVSEKSKLVERDVVTGESVRCQNEIIMLCEKCK